MQFERALESQNIEYLQLDTRPAALNTILWSANVEVQDAYLLADYSFFDSKPITFISYPKNHELLGDLSNDDRVKRMTANSENWFTISKKDDKLFFNDLRFGLLSTEPGADNFVFQYEITRDSDGTAVFTESPKDTRDAKKILGELWNRVWGN